MSIIFSEGSNLNNSIYGKVQIPIQRFLEKRGEQYEQESVLKNLFLMGKSSNFADRFTAMTAMEGFKPVGENGAYPMDGMQESFYKDLVYTVWKNSFSISREIIDDGKMAELKKKPAAFITSYGRTREQFGAALFGQAIQGLTQADFAGAKFDITAADGLPVFHTQHPSKLAKVKTKQSNKFVDGFSVEALDAAESAMHLFKGDNDEILDVAPDTILIPEDPVLKRKVFAAIGADKEPATANNAFNYQYGRWTVIVWSYLNKFVANGTSPWILMDSKYNELYGGAVWNDRVELEVDSDVDKNTSANIWRGYSRFGATFNDWRAFCVGGVSGGTQLVTA
ncbi:MAG: hypothetical protein ACI3W5_07440 [Faecousia sp.]